VNFAIASLDIRTLRNPGHFPFSLAGIADDDMGHAAPAIGPAGVS
jgi:hypothetical protein